MKAGSVVNFSSFVSQTMFVLFLAWVGALAAEGRVFRVLYDGGASKWGDVALEYTLFREDGTGAEASSTRVSMRTLGGDFKVFEIDAPTFPQHFRFVGPSGGWCEKTFYYSDDWDDNQCFRYNSSVAASVEPRKIFYFSILDRHGWLDSGAAGLKFF